ncbi:ice-structuring glycoprotein isoform X4 [Oncorhynchus keta]|uniref:ice-structuring glycoprotein isoform X4 n=1 Tax=Oncorhynchus keta TaxID=8018 RepID=UPI00227CB5CE|nr:ice-structuring glycoprotein isoform X4 [Oncorhynchus keta]
MCITFQTHSGRLGQRSLIKQCFRRKDFMSAKMAASLLRIVRLGSTKCVQVERWSAPAAAALCTKAGGPKKPKKSSSGKKSQGKTYFDLEKLVPHRKYVEFPKKEMTPAAAAELVTAPKPVEAAAAEPIVAAAEAVPAPAAVEATPVVDTVAPATEAIVEPAALVAKATPVVEAAASVAEAAPVAAEAAPIFEASSAADTPVEAVPEAAAPAEAVAEAAPVEAAPVEAAIAEVLVESATIEGAAEALVEVVAEVVTVAAPIEAAAEALIEAVAEVVAEAAQVESALEELIAEPPAEAERIEAPEVQLDPIQKLFLDSIREYSSKSVASGGLVDAGPAYEKNLAEELTKLQRLYGGGDITAFPEFKFTEPKLEEVAPK